MFAEAHFAVIRNVKKRIRRELPHTQQACQGHGRSVMTGLHTVDATFDFLELGRDSVFTALDSGFFLPEPDGLSAFFEFDLELFVASAPFFAGDSPSFFWCVPCQNTWLHPHQCITAT